MNLNSKKDLVYLILAGLFVCNAILGEVLGGKLFQVGPYVISMGVIPWPIVFVTSDLINEYFGKTGVKKLTFLTVGLILYAFLIIFIAIEIPAASVSPVQDREFSIVYGQSLWIIVGSVIAFVVGQLVDVLVFWLFRERTGARHLWLRATGSTAVSQLIDTWIVLGIAFWLPGTLSTSDFLNLAFTNYTYKFVIAVALTPLIYIAHHAIDNYLGKKESDKLIQQAVVSSEGEAT